MNKEEQDAFVEAFITTIGGVDEDMVALWVGGEPESSLDLPYKHIEILDDALAFWIKAKKWQFWQAGDQPPKLYPFSK